MINFKIRDALGFLEKLFIFLIVFYLVYKSKYYA